MPDRAADEAWFRNVLGQYPTGVSVITAIDGDGTPVGMAVGSFTSVSLDPPLVAFLPGAASGSWARIRTSTSFCVNILASDQEPICRRFASRAEDKFADVDWHPAGSGSPILDGAVAWIDCDLHDVHDGGDHHIVVGRVRDLDVHRPTLPLLFFQGGYGRFSPLSLAVRDERFARQLQLVDRARPLMEALSAALNGQVVATFCDGDELTMLASAGAAVDQQVAAAGIGQRVPVVAPVGIWWMAFADAERVDRWLAPLEDETLRMRYRTALAAIRERGYCLSQGLVYEHIETVLRKRRGPGVEPTDEERRELGSLALNPMGYVPPVPGGPKDASLPDGESLGLWAPALSEKGDVELGMMLAVNRPDDRPLHDYADELLALARHVASLAAT